MLIARALQSQYGWPDAFLSDNWEETTDGVLEAAEDWKEWLTRRWKADREAYPNEDEESIVKRWKKDPGQIPNMFEAD